MNWSTIDRLITTRQCFSMMTVLRVRNAPQRGCGETAKRQTVQFSRAGVWRGPGAPTRPWTG